MFYSRLSVPVHTSICPNPHDSPQKHAADHWNNPDPNQPRSSTRWRCVLEDSWSHRSVWCSDLQSHDQSPQTPGDRIQHTSVSMHQIYLQNILAKYYIHPFCFQDRCWCVCKILKPDNNSIACMTLSCCDSYKLTCLLILFCLCICCYFIA